MAPAERAMGVHGRPRRRRTGPLRGLRARRRARAGAQDTGLNDPNRTLARKVLRLLIAPTVLLTPATFPPATTRPTIARRTLARYTRRCVASPAVAQVLLEPKNPDWTRRRWPGRGAVSAELDCGRVPAPPGARMPTLNAGHDGRHGQNGYEEGKCPH